MLVSKHIIAIFTLLLFSLVLFACDDGLDISQQGSYEGIQTLVVPSEYNTLQDAINNASSGDSIIIEDGLYSGTGFNRITFGGKNLVITSAGGPSQCIIAIGPAEESQRSGFIFDTGEDGILINGLTLRDGLNSNGGAVNIRSASPVFRNCIFLDNAGSISGGAVWMKGSAATPLFSNCTFARNGSPAGSAIFMLAGASPTIENCLFTLNDNPPIFISDATSEPDFSCNDIFGNDEGDWTEDIASFLGTAGNISADPKICGTLDENYTIESDSPLLPEYNDCDTYIGALSDTCGSR